MPTDSANSPIGTISRSTRSAMRIFRRGRDPAVEQHFSCEGSTRGGEWREALSRRSRASSASFLKCKLAGPRRAHSLSFALRALVALQTRFGRFDAGGARDWRPHVSPALEAFNLINLASARSPPVLPLLLRKCANSSTRFEHSPYALSLNQFS